MDKRFDTGYFLKRYSHNEILTSVSMSFFFLAVSSLFNLYSHEEFVENFRSVILWFLFVLAFPLHHVVFKFESGSSNNYIGRVFQDCIFLFILLTTIYLSESLRAGNWSAPDFSIAQIIIILIFVFVSAMALEVLVALLKAFLRDRGWNVL